VLPLRDENPTRHLPISTLVIIALNVAAFLFWQPTFEDQREQAEFFYCNALIPYEVINQENLVDAGSEAPEEGREVVRELDLERECPDKSWLFSVFASMFLHGGWLHIGSNMLFLWIFGNNVEDKLRPFLYVVFYLGAGVAATIAQVALVHSGANAVVPNIGASGAVAGVLGAYIFMFPRRRVLTLVMFFFITFVYLPAFVVLGLWFVLQAISGVASLGAPVNAGGGVAFWAHIGGFVFGAILAILFFPKERFGATPPPQRPDYTRRRGFGGRGWGTRRRGPWV
jgi:membrane associated rhomboid family serine protease